MDSTNEFLFEEATRIDIIARNPVALDAIALGADELEILEALSEITPRGLATLAAVVL